VSPTLCDDGTDEDLPSRLPYSVLAPAILSLTESPVSLDGKRSGAKRGYRRNPASHNLHRRWSCNPAGFDRHRIISCYVVNS